MVPRRQSSCTYVLVAILTACIKPKTSQAKPNPSMETGRELDSMNWEFVVNCYHLEEKKEGEEDKEEEEIEGFLCEWVSIAAPGKLTPLQWIPKDPRIFEKDKWP